MHTEKEKKNLLAIVEEFEKLSSASVTDTLQKMGYLKRAVIVHGARPVIENMNVVAGPVVTLNFSPTRELPCEDRSAIWDSMFAGGLGSILVAYGGGFPISMMGSNVISAYRKRGFKAVVLDGGFRDIKDIREMNFPVFATLFPPLDSWYNYTKPTQGVPIQCGGVEVNPGDIMVCDDDGLVVVPREKAEAVIKLAKKQEKGERAGLKAVEEGYIVVDLKGTRKKL